MDGKTCFAIAWDLEFKEVDAKAGESDETGGWVCGSDVHINMLHWRFSGGFPLYRP